METYTAATYPGGLDPHFFDIDVLFWGALIFLAVFVSCFFAWKAIERLRNLRKFSGVAVKPGHIKNPRFAGSLADMWHWDTRTGMVSMTPTKTDEFSLIDETGKPLQRRSAIERLRNRKRPSSLFRPDIGPRADSGCGRHRPTPAGATAHE
jgi:hypothetical protein